MGVLGSTAGSKSFCFFTGEYICRSFIYTAVIGLGHVSFYNCAASGDYPVYCLR